MCPVSFLAFDQPGWVPDGGEHGPALSVAENVLPVNGSYRLIQQKVPQASVADGPVTGALVHIFQQARIVQYARPSADTTPGLWQPNLGTTLWTQIDEGTPNDADFIYVPGAPTAQAVTLALSAIASPGGLTAGHVLQYRYAIPATSGAWSIVAALLQQPGGTVIATDTLSGSGAQPGFLLHVINLTTGQAASITDFTKLAVRFTATVAGAPQVGAPAADNALGGWAGDAGQSLLYPILAPPAQTTHWIVSPTMAPGPTTATYVAALAPLLDPMTRLNHALKYEYMGVGNGLTLTVSLYQGATLVAQDVLANAATAWTTRTRNLTPAEAALITDYTALTVQAQVNYPTDIAPGAAIQQGEPVSTGANNNWVAHGAATLHQCVNAVTPDDTTFIQNTNSSPSVVFPLPPLLAPGGTSYCTMKMRVFNVQGGTGGYDLYLLQGVTQIALLGAANPPAGWNTFSYTLANSEAAAITDWTQLSLKVVGFASADTVQLRVSWVDFEIPQPKQLRLSYVEWDVPSTAQARISWADYEAPDPMTSYKGDVPTIYAGTPTKLYTVGQAWANVSRAGGYAAGTARASGWRFLQVGPDVYATNYVDPIQARLAGAGLFGPLITDPTPAPQARFMAIVRQYMVLADINLTGYGPDWLWWSAAGNPASLTPSPTTQAGNGLLRSRPAQIMGLVGGDNGVIFKRNSVHSLTWTGDQNVFRVDEVSRSVGTPFPNSVVQADGFIYWWGGSCFWVTDGTALPQRVGDQVVANFLADTITSPGAIQPYDPLDMASEDQMMIGSYDPKTGLIRWTYMAQGDQPWRHSRAILYSPKEDRWAAIRLPGANFACHTRQQNSITNETLYEHGTIGFDWDGTTSTWFKYSGSGTYTATIATQIRPIGLDKADMPIGARTRGYSYVPNPQQDYPIRARLREIFPMYSETAASGPPNSAQGTPITLTVECSEDPFCRPGSGSYRIETFSNLIANERFTFPVDDLAAFWWRFTFTLGPLANARMIYAFRGAWLSWEPRSRG